MTHDGSMGRTVYLPTGLVDFYGFHVGKYTSPMDPIWGKNRCRWSIIWRIFETDHDLCWMIFNIAPHMWLYKTLHLHWDHEKIRTPWWSNNAKIDLDGTPWKINMEHTNHPFRKENYLPNLYGYVPCQSSRVFCGLVSKFHWSWRNVSYPTSWMVRISSFCRLPRAYSITPQGPFCCMFQLQQTIRGPYNHCRQDVSLPHESTQYADLDKIWTIVMKSMSFM